MLLQDDEGGDRERDADVEAPAPAERVGDDAADQRAGDGAEAEDRAEVAGVAAALARGDEVGEDHLDERGQPADADALEDAAGDQPARRLREAARIEPPT